MKKAPAVKNGKRKKISASAIGIAIIFTLIFTLGLCTAADYGVYCDEPSEQVILRENLKEYAAALGDAGALAYYDRLGVQRSSESVEIDHGQSAYYLLAPALTLCETNSALLHWLWHAYSWGLFTLGLLGLYLLLREMGLGVGPAMAGAAMMLLSPRFFAEGHYNNKDMALLVLVIWCFYLALRLWKKPTPLRALLFSLACALAANTKIVGLLVWGMLSVAALVSVTARKQWSLRTGMAAATALLSFVLFYVLLTPAMWKDPAAYLLYLLNNASSFSRWTGVVLFRGERYDQMVAPLTRRYLPLMIFYTLPLYFFPLCAVGQLAAAWDWIRQPGKCLREPEKLLLLCATLLWTLLMGYVILRQPLIYNGWRHFYFLYAGFAVLAAWGLEWLLRRLKGLNSAAIAGILALCMAADGVGILQNHPYQYTYYNFLAPAGAEETMELDYWDVSTVNALRLLMEAERNEKLPLNIAGTDALSQYGLDIAISALTAEEKDRLTVIQQQADVPYLFMNTTYGRIYGVTVPRDYHVLLTIESYGQTICTVYERMEKGMWRD